MNSSIQKKIVLLVLLALGLSVTACNTTRGVGEDVEEAGEEIQEATK
jgi:predicted small secreted protein